MISIILSSYNGEKYIKEQLNSIANQTYKNFEIIIVDDCSTDSTLEIIQDYVDKYENIFLYKGVKNLGYIKNFERGVKLAKGSYIAFSDQDDYWLPEKLEILINSIKSYDVVYCDSELVNSKLEPLNRNMSTGHNFITSKNPLNFVVKNCVSGHAMIFKRELLENNFDFPELIPHDWWITFLASCNNGVLFVNKPLVKYRIHDSNVIAGEGHKKVSKKQKNIQRKFRLKSFLNIVQKDKNFKSKILNQIFKSYNSNSLLNRIRRVVVFTENVEPLFKISGRKLIKKYFYAFSMFFKIR